MQPPMVDEDTGGGQAVDRLYGGQSLGNPVKIKNTFVDLDAEDTDFFREQHLRESFQRIMSEPARPRISSATGDFPVGVPQGFSSRLGVVSLAAGLPNVSSLTAGLSNVSDFPAQSHFPPGQPARVRTTSNADDVRPDSIDLVATM
ncbi:unnamed protein product, partial [Polarella glacialis]